MLDGKRVINGTFGQVLLDGEEVAETIGCQAKLSYKTADIHPCGDLAIDKKVLGYDGTGNIKMYKVNSRMLKKVGNLLKDGKEVRFTITSKLADPDSFGYETVVIKNVLFTDLTLIDWTSGKEGEIECPFIFTRFEFRDLIDPQ